MAKLRILVSSSFNTSSKIEGEKAVWWQEKKKSGCASASVPTHPAEGWLSKYECLKRLHKWTSACSQSRRAPAEPTGNKWCAKDGEGHFYDDRRFPDALLSFVLFFLTSLNMNNPAWTCTALPSLLRAASVWSARKKKTPMCPYCWIKINFALIPSEAAARPFFFSSLFQSTPDRTA